MDQYTNLLKLEENQYIPLRLFTSLHSDYSLILFLLDVQNQNFHFLNLQFHKEINQIHKKYKPKYFQLTTSQEGRQQFSPKRFFIQNHFF